MYLIGIMYCYLRSELFYNLHGKMNFICPNKILNFETFYYLCLFKNSLRSKKIAIWISGGFFPPPMMTRRGRENSVRIALELTVCPENGKTFFPMEIFNTL